VSRITRRWHAYYDRRDVLDDVLDDEVALPPCALDPERGLDCEGVSALSALVRDP
jgi:hypothetical protein